MLLGTKRKVKSVDAVVAIPSKFLGLGSGRASRECGLLAKWLWRATISFGIPSEWTLLTLPVCSAQNANIFSDLEQSTLFPGVKTNSLSQILSQISWQKINPSAVPLSFHWQSNLANYGASLCGTPAVHVGQFVFIRRNRLNCTGPGYMGQLGWAIECPNYPGSAVFSSVQSPRSSDTGERNFVLRSGSFLLFLKSETWNCEFLK